MGLKGEPGRPIDMSKLARVDSEREAGHLPNFMRDFVRTTDSIHPQIQATGSRLLSIQHLSRKHVLT